jgi:hypothetical protein
MASATSSLSGPAESRVLAITFAVTSKIIRQKYICPRGRL